jgi:hypothetical protein
VSNLSVTFKVDELPLLYWKSGGTWLDSSVQEGFFFFHSDLLHSAMLLVNKNKYNSVSFVL